MSAPARERDLLLDAGVDSSEVQDLPGLTESSADMQAFVKFGPAHPYRTTHGSATIDDELV